MGGGAEGWEVKGGGKEGRFRPLLDLTILIYFKCK